MGLRLPFLRWPTEQVGRGRSAVVGGVDPCRPAFCALGGTPHVHCPCGLPMAVGATRCDLCLAEDFRPRPLRPTDHLVEWDGVSYPSLRRNRPVDVPHEQYIGLLQTILDPAFDAVAEPATAGEAA
jgi:hypothetical protein